MLGTGEFAYPPFSVANYLDHCGVDVHFQTTTRSPILTGGAIHSVVSTVDNYGEGIANFVYNVADREYDRIFLCYETSELPNDHKLAKQLNAETIFFTADGLRVEPQTS